MTLLRKALCDLLLRDHVEALEGEICHYAPSCPFGDYAGEVTAMAAIEFAPDCLKLLLDKGYPLLSMLDGKPLLHEVIKRSSSASEHFSLEIITTLLDKGVDVNERDNHGQPPLYYAVFSFPSIIRLLARYGADLAVPLHSAPASALGLAITMGKGSCVHMLLDLGVDPNKAGPNSDPAIALAAEHGRLDFMEALLEHGADPLLQNTEGKTAQQIAAGEQFRAGYAAEVEKLVRTYHHRRQLEQSVVKSPAPARGRL